MVIIGAYYYNLLLWFPFYFTFIHYGQYASYLSLIVPICLAVGSISFQNLIGLCPSFTHWVSSLLYLLAAIAHRALLEVNKADGQTAVGLYFMLVVTGSFIVEGPYAEIGIN